MGRKKIPVKTKIIQGTFRKDRESKNLPAPPESKKERPPWWMKGHIARKAWRELSAYLKENGLLTNLDEIALEMLVTAYSKWREAREKAKIGFYKTPTGLNRVNPMIAVEKIYHQQLSEMLTEFGMTPGSRSESNTQKDNEEDLIQKMLDENDQDKKKKD